MSTPNYGLIPKQTLVQATRGVVQAEVSVADRVCNIRTDIETLSGNAPLLTSGATTRRRENINLQPGAHAKPASGGFATIGYNCLRQTGFSEVFDESQISAAAFDLDLVAHWVGEAVKQANTNADAILEEALSDEALNLVWDATVDGNGPWDDPTSGTPMDDILFAADKVPGFDSVILGKGVGNAIRTNPQSYGRLSHFSGGTVATNGELVAGLAALLDIPADNVSVLGDDFYNIGEEGQDFEVEYVFNGGFWLGKKADLQLFDPQNDENRKSEVGRVPAAAMYQLVHHRYVDIKRSLKENGIYAKNVLS